MSVPAGLFDELRALKKKSLYREVKVLNHFEGPRATYRGGPLTLFCGNDYLGLSSHPRVLKAAERVLKGEGLGSGASRLISGTTEFHEKLEKKIAAFKGVEKALVYTTGYMANLGTLTALAGEQDLIVLDKLCHASLVDGARLSGAALRVFPHKNYERLEKILKGATGFRRKLIVTDGVFSMDGDLANIPRFVQIKKRYDCLLVVDDAHGTGVLGRHGHGIQEQFEEGSDIDVLVGTLSKGLGCLGGFVAGTEALIDTLVNRSRPFIYATSLPAMVCEAAYEALSVVEEEPIWREQLWKNASTMHLELARLGWVDAPLTAPIFPVIVGESETALHLSQRLLENGFLVPAIRTPTVQKGKARLRVTVSARHSKEEIGAFCKALSNERAESR